MTFKLEGIATSGTRYYGHTLYTLIVKHNPLWRSAHVYILSEKGAVHPVRFLFDRHREFAR